MLRYAARCCFAKTPFRVSIVLPFIIRDTAHFDSENVTPVVQLESRAQDVALT